MSQTHEIGAIDISLVNLLQVNDVSQIFSFIRCYVEGRMPAQSSKK